MCNRERVLSGHVDDRLIVGSGHAVDAQVVAPVAGIVPVAAGGVDPVDLRMKAKLVERLDVGWGQGAIEERRLVDAALEMEEVLARHESAEGEIVAPT